MGKPDLLPGTLDMLILKTLKRAPLHGYGIAQSIKQLSDNVLTVEEGSLYPAHDDDDVLASRRHADVGPAIHGNALRQAPRSLQE